MYALYDLLMIGLLIAASPYYLYKMIRESKYRAGFRQRFGFYPQSVRRALSKGDWIWVHAVSLGEVNAVAPLLRELRQSAPRYKVAVSTVTDTGQEQATKLGLADAVFYLPLDIGFLIDRLLKSFKPSILVIAETEIWPRLIERVGKIGAPVVLVNGRISDRSFHHYRRAKLLVRRVLGRMALIGVQSERDAERVKDLGAPADRVVVLGNLKFDAIVPGSDDRKEMEDLGRAYRLEGTEKIIIGGSTWPGEEEALIRGYLRWIKKDPSVRLLIAPRHTNRVEEIEGILRNSGLSWRRRTQSGVFGSDAQGRPPVLILDTHGELNRVYGLAWAVFVGKSLTAHGGQNPLEPAAKGCPVFFGANMENFTEISKLLLDGNAARVVSDAEDLIRTIEGYLGNAEAQKGMGGRARDLIRSKQGVAARTAEEIISRLGGYSACLSPRSRDKGVVQ